MSDMALSEIPMPQEDEIAALRRILYEKYGENANLMKIQTELVVDLEKALNMVVAYQRTIRILRSPDPNFVEARKLLTKYKMVGIEPAEEFKVFADGVDITLHPDSIESTAEVEGHVVQSEIVTVGVGELTLPEDEEWKDEQGIETAELVADEKGNIRLRSKPKLGLPGFDFESDAIDDEDQRQIDPSSRDWLKDNEDATN